ncbi:MAG: class I SAM-dependent methyltransferase, partial [Elioraea tepidiphila]
MPWLDGGKELVRARSPQGLGMGRRLPLPSLRSGVRRMLFRFLDAFVHFGRLRVIDAEGCVGSFGPGGTPAVTIRLHDPGVAWRLLSDPDLAVGEAYMDGTLTIEEGTLREFLDLCVGNAERLRENPAHRLRAALVKPLRRYRQYNPIRRARANVAHHYDLSGALYDLFLDRDRQYSCAYFADGNESLEAAQAKKKRHIAAKL